MTNHFTKIILLDIKPFIRSSLFLLDSNSAPLFKVIIALIYKQQY